MGILDGVVEITGWVEDGVLDGVVEAPGWVEDGVLDDVVEAIDWVEEGLSHELGVICGPAAATSLYQQGFTKAVVVAYVIVVEVVIS